MKLRENDMKRNETLDIVKGITIIIVVALHASIPISWMTLFQMPVFFYCRRFLLFFFCNRVIFHNKKIYLEKSPFPLYPMRNFQHFNKPFS